MDAKIFWDNVEPLREAKNLTQKKLSNIIKVPFRTFQGWLSKGILPDVEQAAKIAAALGTTVEYLVTGKDPARPDTSKALKHLEAVQDFLKNL
jgi:transcriptional regulator with XRE-family HTH domain